MHFLFPPFLNPHPQMLKLFANFCTVLFSELVEIKDFLCKKYQTDKKTCLLMFNFFISPNSSKIMQFLNTYIIYSTVLQRREARVSKKYLINISIFYQFV